MLNYIQVPACHEFHYFEILLGPLIGANVTDISSNVTNFSTDINASQCNGFC